MPGSDSATHRLLAAFGQSLNSVAFPLEGSLMLAVDGFVRDERVEQVQFEFGKGCFRWGFAAPHDCGAQHLNCNLNGMGKDLAGRRLAVSIEVAANSLDRADSG